MNPLKTLAYNCMSWHRKWCVVDFKEENWSHWNDKRDQYAGRPCTYTYNRTLILERCAYTGFERAYRIMDNTRKPNEREYVDIGVAKSILGIIKPGLGNQNNLSLNI